MSVTPDELVREITNARFTPVRLREAYRMEDVDGLLERVRTVDGRPDPPGAGVGAVPAAAPGARGLLLAKVADPTP